LPIARSPRALGKPLVTVIQADAHPASRGFVWWKPRPASIPSPVPIVNAVLARHGLPAIAKMEELSVGDLTLVVGTPETDPLPPDADVTYVGPILWQQDDAQLPAWIRALGRDRPIVWIYSGNPRYTSGGGALDSMIVRRARATRRRTRARVRRHRTGHDDDRRLRRAHTSHARAARPLIASRPRAA
jgi:hypothetical protein